MSSIASVAASSFYDRREAISVEADDRQQQAITSVLTSGFAFDWPTMVRDTVADDPLPELQTAVDAALQGEEFTATVEALRVNGRLIAALAQQRHERLAGARRQALVAVSAGAFAEAPALFRPEGAISFWRRLLGLTDEVVEAMLQGARAFQPDEPFVLASRIAKDVNSQLAALHEKAVSEGLPLTEFKKQAAEVMPDLTAHVLETEYRTRMTQAYAGARHEQVVQRANAFPFMQYLIIKDGRTTWWICLPMGTAGPGGRHLVHLAPAESLAVPVRSQPHQLPRSNPPRVSGAGWPHKDRRRRQQPTPSVRRAASVRDWSRRKASQG
jgi:hypothetical protein